MYIMIIISDHTINYHYIHQHVIVYKIIDTQYDYDIIIPSNDAVSLGMSHLPGLKFCAWLLFGLHSQPHENIGIICDHVRKNLLKFRSTSGANEV